MTISRWADMMPHTVMIEPWQGVDEYGAPTYGVAVIYRARVQAKIRKIVTAQGEEVVSMLTCYIAGLGITPQDRITLPNQFSPNQPKILDVGLISDETGLHHSVVYA